VSSSASTAERLQHPNDTNDDRLCGPPPHRRQSRRCGLDVQWVLLTGCATCAGLCLRPCSQLPTPTPPSPSAPCRLFADPGLHRHLRLLFICVEVSGPDMSHICADLFAAVCLSCSIVAERHVVHPASIPCLVSVCGGKVLARVYNREILSWKTAGYIVALVSCMHQWIR
jgi:hypothetical protein